MKKFLALVVAFTMLFAITVGCGTSGSEEASTNTTIVDNREKADTEPETSNLVPEAAPVETEEDSTTPATASNGISISDNRNQTVVEEAAKPKIEVTDDDFDVTGYLYKSTFTTMYFLIVTNNSEATVSVKASGTAKDGNGNVVAVDDCDIDVLGPGEQSITYFYFSDADSAETVDYTLSYNNDPYYSPILADLSTQLTLNDKNVTAIVTNNGKTVAQYVQGYTLFFDASGNMVDYGSTYIGDGNNEIAPGASASGQMDSYEAFDHVEVYLTGRSDGSETSSNLSVVSDDDFDVIEYTYEGSSSTQYFLIITNNSDKAVGISGNATAFDASGNVLGADDCSIDVLGPGEQSIDYFYFNGVTGVAAVEYQLSYDEDPYYEPVLSNLSAEVYLNDKNAIVTITNNGDIVADFVQAHVLFFDASGNIVAESSRYVTDDDNEIKPGEQQSAQINAYETFDHAEVYLTGRHSKW